MENIIENEIVEKFGKSDKKPPNAKNWKVLKYKRGYITTFGNKLQLKLSLPKRCLTEDCNLSFPFVGRVKAGSRKDIAVYDEGYMTYNIFIKTNEPLVTEMLNVDIAYFRTYESVFKNNDTARGIIISLKKDNKLEFKIVRPNTIEYWGLNENNEQIITRVEIKDQKISLEK